MKYGRPVANRTENIVVKLEVYLVQIIDLDERDQVLISNVETQYEWYDNGLKWDKELYGGIHDVRLPVDQIWTPDIVLYNYADTRLEEKREVLAIINSNGRVRWRPSSIFKSTCQINIQNFPYDQQSCRMKFGSWTYNGFKVLSFAFSERLSTEKKAGVINSSIQPICNWPYKREREKTFLNKKIFFSNLG